MLKVHPNSGPAYDSSQLFWLSVSLSDIQNITAVTASGYDLALCCKILGRQRPNNNIYVFVGDNAREIVLNWQTQRQTQTKNNTN
jgi:hypothetical protein